MQEALARASHALDALPERESRREDSLHTQELNKLFTAKYGAAYAQEVVENKDKYLSQRLVRMLTNMQACAPRA